MTKTPASIVVCSWSGRGGAAASAGELLTAGRRLATLVAGDLVWLVLGALPADAEQIATRYGASRIDHLGDAAFTGFSADRYVAALAAYCREQGAGTILFSQTDESRVVAARLAARLGAGVVMNAVDVAVDAEGKFEVTATAFGGDVRAVYGFTGEGPCVIAITPGAVNPEPVTSDNGAVTVRSITGAGADIAERVTVLQPATASGPRLEEARVVVAGGRGLGRAENVRLIERLAAALGGLPAATRAIVDDGWADATRQVGLTGKVTKPDLYIAAGISGASQHMAGCSSARTIVAINRDPGAAIFRYARYGVVGDCAAVLNELIAAVEGA